MQLADQLQKYMEQSEWIESGDEAIVAEIAFLMGVRGK